MKKLANDILKVLGSLQLAILCLLLIMVLTFLGTLHQVDHGLYQAQHEFFYSWITFAAGLPLPGGMTAMGLFTINLLVGGIIRFPWKWSKAGILVTHFGIALLMLAGLVNAFWAKEGYVQLYEGESADEYADYYLWEIAVTREDGDNLIEDRVNIHGGHDGTTITDDAWPFTLAISDWEPAATVFPRQAPMAATGTPVGAFALVPLDRHIEETRNFAGCIVTVRTRDGNDRQMILWGGDLTRAVIDVGGESYGFRLRKRLYPLGFTVRLDDFHHEFHPGTRKAKKYESEITVFADNTERSHRIVMNRPLRRHGVVAYQSSWGPQDAAEGDRLFSGFAVVRNPSDQWPLYACIVIAAGLTWHFIAKFIKFTKRVAREESELLEKDQAAETKTGPAPAQEGGP